MDLFLTKEQKYCQKLFDTKYSNQYSYNTYTFDIPDNIFVKYDKIYFPSIILDKSEFVQNDMLIMEYCEQKIYYHLSPIESTPSYFYLPFFDDLLIQPRQQVTLNLKNKYNIPILKNCNEMYKFVEEVPYTNSYFERIYSSPAEYVISSTKRYSLVLPIKDEKLYTTSYVEPSGEYIQFGSSDTFEIVKKFNNSSTYVFCRETGRLLLPFKYKATL